MKKIVFVIFSLIIGGHLFAQELFTYTEPASNMAAHSFGIRSTQTLMKSEEGNHYSLHFLPECMWAFSRKFMAHVEGFFSNRNGSFVGEGGGVYGKYRFYSNDDIHSHFRMAFYGQFSMNTSDVHREAIDLKGHNSGYELGLVFTKLQHKTAVSGSFSTVHALSNGSNADQKFPDSSRSAIGYTLSVGQLVLPKNYISYNQVNWNIMLEMLGQTNLETKKSYLDLAPVLQWVILSKMRVDLGYRFAMMKNLSRSNPEGFLLRFEYNFFNVFK